MCDLCGNPDHVKEIGELPRRKFLSAGVTALAAGSVLAASRSSVLAQKSDSNSETLGETSFKTRGYAAASATSGFLPIDITRRALGPKDVLIDTLYVGVCHSDIHTVHGDWGPPNYPVIPGHEIIGRIIAVGDEVTKFKIGDIGGVGCMVDSCGSCENCLNDREQNCLNGATFTYDAPDKVSGGRTYGGYSEHIVVTEGFVIRIPPQVDLAAYAPLLCAGVTNFSPIRYWKLESGQKLAVLGLGGLGHMALKLGVAHRADVTVFTTSARKIADAKRMGAKETYLWTDEEAFTRNAGNFDLMISTVPVSFAMQPFMDMLKLDATLVNVGALTVLEGGLNGQINAFGRKSLAGSMIGGIAETQQVIDYCAARNIKSDIELITPDQLDRAYERIIAKDVRYRFVIDFASSKEVK